MTALLISCAMAHGCGHDAPDSSGTAGTPEPFTRPAEPVAQTLPYSLTVS